MARSKVKGGVAGGTAIRKPLVPCGGPGSGGVGILTFSQPHIPGISSSPQPLPNGGKRESGTTLTRFRVAPAEYSLSPPLEMGCRQFSVQPFLLRAHWNRPALQPSDPTVKRNQTQRPFAG